MAMSCEDARGLLIDRLLDELDAESLERLEAHLAGCAACRTAAREMSEVWDAMAGVSLPAADPGASIRFGRRLERERAGARIPPPLLAAAATALLAAGGLVGHALAPGGGPVPSGDRLTSSGGDPPAAAVPVAEEDSPRFLMLLRGDEPDRRQPRERLVEEYSAWAGELAAAGVLVSAEELDPETAEWVAPDTETDREAAPVGGYFLIEAPSYDSALALARASPHAAYGGLIEIRRIAGGR